MKNHAGHEYFELQVIRLETDNRDDYKIIMGFRYIDDIVQEDMKKKQQMEETMADLKLNNEIISAISKMYRIIYRMDLIHDTYEEISSQESMHRLTGSSVYKSRREIHSARISGKNERISGCFHSGRASEEQRGGFHRIQSHNRSLVSGKIYCKASK